MNILEVSGGTRKFIKFGQNISFKQKSQFCTKLTPKIPSFFTRAWSSDRAGQAVDSSVLDLAYMRADTDTLYIQVKAISFKIKFIIELQGYALLVIQSHSLKLQPELCGEQSCLHGTKALLFYASIYLLALGGGGIRGCVPALGGDQFDDKIPKERIQLASFFNWFLFSITIGATLGVTFVVYVSTEYAWYKGFLISLSCSSAALICIFAGKRFYRTRIPGESPLLSILQVPFSPFSQITIIISMSILRSSTLVVRLPEYVFISKRQSSLYKPVL
jgi:MFS family permease